MLFCCNAHFVSSFSYVLLNTNSTYRKIEFGVCPICGCFKFKDYIQSYNGNEKVKLLSGKAANDRLNYWKKRLKNVKQGTKSRQNTYYGDFQKTNRKDENGNPIYLQLRKNFNNQSEVIGEVKTLVRL